MVTSESLKAEVMLRSLHPRIRSYSRPSPEEVADYLTTSGKGSAQGQLLLLLSQLVDGDARAAINMLDLVIGGSVPLLSTHEHFIRSSWGDFLTSICLDFSLFDNVGRLLLQGSEDDAACPSEVECVWEGLDIPVVDSVDPLNAIISLDPLDLYIRGKNFLQRSPNTDQCCVINVFINGSSDSVASVIPMSDCLIYCCLTDASVEGVYSVTVSLTDTVSKIPVSSERAGVGLGDGYFQLRNRVVRSGWAISSASKGRGTRKSEEKKSSGKKSCRKIRLTVDEELQINEQEIEELPVDTDVEKIAMVTYTSPLPVHTRRGRVVVESSDSEVEVEVDMSTSKRGRAKICFDDSDDDIPPDQQVMISPAGLETAVLTCVEWSMQRSIDIVLSPPLEALVTPFKDPHLSITLDVIGALLSQRMYVRDASLIDGQGNKVEGRVEEVPDVLAFLLDFRKCLSEGLSMLGDDGRGREVVHAMTYLFESSLCLLLKEEADHFGDADILRVEVVDNQLVVNILSTDSIPIQLSRFDDNHYTSPSPLRSTELLDAARSALLGRSDDSSAVHTLLGNSIATINNEINNDYSDNNICNMNQRNDDAIPLPLSEEELLAELSSADKRRRSSEGDRKLSVRFVNVGSDIEPLEDLCSLFDDWSMADVMTTRSVHYSSEEASSDELGLGFRLREVSLHLLKEKVDRNRGRGVDKYISPLTELYRREHAQVDTYISFSSYKLYSHYIEE